MNKEIMNNKYLVDPIEGQKKVLQWLGSDEYNKLFENTSCNQSTDFKAGAMWGAAMASIIITTDTTKFGVSGQSREELAEEVEEKMMYMCGCLNCIEKIKMIILGKVVPYDSKCSECGMYEDCMKKLKNKNE